MAELTREQALDGIEKSVLALVDIQWELHSYGTLSSEVRSALLGIGEYYLEALVLTSPERALGLIDKLAQKTAEREAANAAQ